MKKVLKNGKTSVKIEATKPNREGEQDSADMVKSPSSTQITDKNRDKPKKEPWMSLGRAVKEIQTEGVAKKAASVDSEGTMKAIDSVSRSMDQDEEERIRERARKRAGGK